MIDFNEYPNIAAVLRRLARMRDLNRSDNKDKLDKIVEDCAPKNIELTYDELELAAAAEKQPELPEYLKKKEKNM